jgi:hypothetical protein
MFGVPDNEDPDPYGVLALEKAGMAVRDAGTHEPASWEQFSFNPSPTSPIHAVFAARTSGERPRSYSSRPGSWRTSTQSSVLLTAPKAPSSLRTSIEQSRPSPTMADSSTQTDFPDLPISTRTSARTSVTDSRRSSRGSGSNSRRSSKMQDVPEGKVLDTSPERREPASVSTANGYTTPPRTPPVDDTPRPAVRHQIAEEPDHDHDEDDDEDDEEVQIVEQPVMHSIQTIQPVSQQAISKARLVTVAKRLPPKLPPRNPNRSGKGPIVIGASPIGSPREASPATSDRLSSRASHRSISPPSSTAHASLAKDMEEIKLDDEDDEIEQRNPWAKVQEQRKSEEAEREIKRGRESMPGGFD